ncbi:DUF1655 domain-containing protein [Lactococcus petauri]|uniref:DUF1655 domain-containing protein n=1 Tax=Lactococcus petauri TaxID=1940789 RepID=UPI001F573E1C|nr:DUF1655 domain-containing protein [Lactococcus petauri]
MTEFISIDEAEALFAQCLDKARHHIKVDDITDKLFDARTIVTFPFLGNSTV